MSASDDAALSEAADGFFLAAEHGRSDVIKALVDHGDGKLDLARIVDAATGRSPLHVAVVNRKTDALRVLLAAGFPPHIESSERSSTGETRPCTAYALAVEAKAHDLVFVFHQFAVQQVAMDSAQGVAQLLAAGVPLDVTDGAATGNTLLHWAVTCRALAVCELLLEREGSATLVNLANAAEGATPLHIACRDGKFPFVRLLLAHGADPRCTGTGGFCKDKTPADLATSTEIRQLLESHEERLLEASAKDEQGESERDEPVRGMPQMSTEPVVAVEADVVAALRRKHALQLEEKDLLIRQLKTTIETLVVEAQEIRKLGEERTVLDYIRKLREEKDVVRRQLEDAEDHIRIQQQQIQELKRQIRSMEPPAALPPRPSPPPPKQHKQQEESPTANPAAGMSAELDELASLITVPANDQPAATTMPNHATLPASRIDPVPPVQINVTPPRSQRRSTPPRSSSGAWNDVWAVLLGNGLQADDVEADGEVIMTV